MATCRLSLHELIKGLIAPETAENDRQQLLFHLGARLDGGTEADITAAGLTGQLAIQHYRKKIKKPPEPRRRQLGMGHKRKAFPEQQPHVPEKVAKVTRKRAHANEKPRVLKRRRLGMVNAARPSAGDASTSAAAFAPEPVVAPVASIAGPPLEPQDATSVAAYAPVEPAVTPVASFAGPPVDPHAVPVVNTAGAPVVTPAAGPTSTPRPRRKRLRQMTFVPGTGRLAKITKFEPMPAMTQQPNQFQEEQSQMPDQLQRELQQPQPQQLQLRPEEQPGQQIEPQQFVEVAQPEQPFQPALQQPLHTENQPTRPSEEVQQTEQTPEQPAEQPPEQPAEQPPEQPAEQPTEQPAEQPTEQPAEQPPEQPAEQPTEQPAGQPTEQVDRQPTQSEQQPEQLPPEQNDFGDSPFQELEYLENSSETLRVYEKEILVAFKPNNQAAETNFLFHLDRLIAKLKAPSRPTDKVGLTITGNGDDSVPIEIPFSAPAAVNAAAVLEKVSTVTQSNENFVLEENGQLRIKCVVFRDYTGGQPPDNPNEELFKKLNVVVSKCRNINHKLTRGWAKRLSNRTRYETITRNRMCAGYAIIAGRLFNDWQLCTDEEQKKNKMKLYKNEALRQTTQQFAKWVDDLYDEAGVDPETGCNMEDIRSFDSVSDHSIVVYLHNEEKKEQIIFDTRPDKPGKPIVKLLFTNDHFDFLKTEESFYRNRRHCGICGKRNSTSHLCKNTCRRCFGDCKTQREMPLFKKCPDCNFEFRSPACYRMHKQRVDEISGLSRCELVKLCKDCKTMYSTSGKYKHECDLITCKNCQQRVQTRHPCYIQQDTKTPQQDDEKLKHIVISFYDIETTVSKKKHEACLIVSETLCFYCENADVDESTCCNKRRNQFENMTDSTVNPVIQFIKHAQKSCKNKKIDKGVQTGKRVHYLIGHNAAKFDTHLLLKGIVKMKEWKVKKIMNTGLRFNKVICTHKKTGDTLVLMDSYCFIAASLANMGRAFGVKEEKGCFPHSLTRRENYQMILNRLPDVRHYHPELMNPEKRAELLKWHKEEDLRIRRNGGTWCLRDELIKYCVNDVIMLRIAFQRFRTTMRNLGADPIASGCHTIAMLSWKIYVRRFMTPDTICRVPLQGYRLRDNQSKLAIEYLSAIELRDGVTIKHAGRCREEVIKGAGVDGYLEKDGVKHIYEVLGCVFHGCYKCNGPNCTRRFPDATTPAIRYAKTMSRISLLEEQKDTKVHFIWEHDVRKFFKKNPELMRRVKELPWITHPPLKIEDALRGGMTSPFVLYMNCEKNEQIGAVDFCSMYPTVQCFGVFPVGEPEVLLGQDIPQLNDIFGFLYCTILPPKNMRLPPLMDRFHGKLMGVLCRTCVELKCKDSCPHSDSERALTGTWTTPELKLAVRYGYKILEAFECYHFPQKIQYLKDQDVHGLFDRFMCDLLKLKTEATGYPKIDPSDDWIEEYCASFHAVTGIHLDKDNIAKNPILRYVSKLLMNSLWGKLAQRIIDTQTDIITEPEDLVALFYTPGVVVKNIVILDNDTVLVTSQHPKEVGVGNKNGNKCLAAMITAYGRIMLYAAMSRVAPNCLAYTDTDSLFFKHEIGKSPITTGEHLGQLTDELASYGEGAYISEIASAGAKNYCYIVNIPQEDGSEIRKPVRKLKGFTLKSDGVHASMETLKRLVDGQLTSVTFDQPGQIRRTKNLDIVSEDQRKRMNFTFDKRIIEENYQTRPWGAVLSEPLQDFPLPESFVPWE